MAYESPIKINYQEGIPEFRTFHEEINEKIECRIMASVQEKMAIQINKEELIKALNYDRHQYEHGFRDGQKSMKEALKKRFEELHLHPDLIELIDNAQTGEEDTE